RGLSGNGVVPVVCRHAHVQELERAASGGGEGSAGAVARGNGFPLSATSTVAWPTERTRECGPHGPLSCRTAWAGHRATGSGDDTQRPHAVRSADRVGRLSRAVSVCRRRLWRAVLP